MSRVVIIGAGIAGLAAAHALRDAVDGDGRPTETVIVETAQRVGGKLAVAPIAGIDVDEGAESFLTRVPEGRELVEACGLGSDLVHPATTQAGVWVSGRLRPIPAGTVLGIPSSVRSVRALLTPFEQARAELDRVLPGDPPGDTDVAVGRWARRRLGPAIVDRLVDPLLGGVYAGHADELSLQATMPMLDRTHRSALAAAAASIPAPAVPAQPVFGTLRDGLGSLPDAVLAASGAQLVPGRTVRRIGYDPCAAEPWQVTHGPTVDEQVIGADAVIVAVPATPAARLLQPVAPAAAAELAAVEAASLAIVTTAWRSRDAGPATGSGYLVPAASRPRRPVKAVTFSSAKWAHLRGGGVVVVRCSIGRHGEAADLQHDDADLIAMATAELTGHAGFGGAPVESRVTRWGGGLPQYAVGHRDRVRRIRAAVAELPGLAVCGATYDGVGVPACIRTGREAADVVRRHLAASGAPAADDAAGTGRG